MRKLTFPSSSGTPRTASESSSPSTASRSSELVRCHERGGIDFDKLEADRRRLGIEDASPEEAEAMIAAFHDPALSRRVLGLEGDE